MTPPRQQERKPEMSFEEAMERARAAHTITKVCHQPGNDYREEYICKCGRFVMATNWKQHIINAADALRLDTKPQR